MADVKGVGHLIGDTIDPRRGMGKWKRKPLSPERLALLNKPRFIHHFEVTKQNHQPCNTPIIIFQYSSAGPQWRFCAKCKLILEEPIER